MSDTNRRGFLKLSTAAVAALTGGAAATAAGCAADEKPAARAGLDPAILRSIGAVALPSELGEAGVERAVAGFESWLAGFEPVAELAHGYGSDEIRYGPPDPGPRWQSQLAGLELEASKRHGMGFAALPAEERRGIIAREVGREGEGMPDAQAAQHVATALISHFFASSEARDLCYRARIGMYQCRGLATAEAKPAPLDRSV